MTAGNSTPLSDQRRRGAARRRPAGRARRCWPHVVDAEVGACYVTGTQDLLSPGPTPCRACWNATAAPADFDFYEVQAFASTVLATLVRKREGVGDIDRANSTSTATRSP